MPVREYGAVLYHNRGWGLRRPLDVGEVRRGWAGVQRHTLAAPALPSSTGRPSALRRQLPRRRRRAAAALRRPPPVPSTLASWRCWRRTQRMRPAGRGCGPRWAPPASPRGREASCSCLQPCALLSRRSSSTPSRRFGGAGEDLGGQLEQVESALRSGAEKLCWIESYFATPRAATGGCRRAARPARLLRRHPRGCVGPRLAPRSRGGRQRRAARRVPALPRPPCCSGRTAAAQRSTGRRTRSASASIGVLVRSAPGTGRGCPRCMVLFLVPP